MMGRPAGAARVCRLAPLSGPSVRLLPSSSPIHEKKSPFCFLLWRSAAFWTFSSRRRISHAFGGEGESPTCAAIIKQPSPPARRWRGILHSCWLSPKGLLSESKGRDNRLFSEELEQWGRGSHKRRKKGGRAPKANGPFFPLSVLSSIPNINGSI